MADIRIKDLGTTASVTASDDFMAVDGTTNGTRKLSAATPSFATSVTVPGVSAPASTALTLAGGSTGASLVLGHTAGASMSSASKLNLSNTTSASSSTTGALTIGNGTAATNVAIGGGNVNAGGTLVVGTTYANSAKAFIFGTLKVGGDAGQATGTIVLGDDQSSGQNVGIYRGQTGMVVGAGNWLNVSGYDGVNITSGAAAFGSQTKALAATSTAVSIPLSTPSTLTTNGALVVTGGVGVGGAVNVGGVLTATSPAANGLIVRPANGNSLAIFDASAGGADANAYITLQTSGTNRWVFGQSISAVSGDFEIYSAPLGASALKLAKATGAATFAGAVSLSTAGTTVSIKSGTNAAAGTVTLSGGAATITSTAIDVNTVIVMSIKTKSGSFDHAPSVVVAAGSATIDGHNNDASTYNWIALKVD
jgi:hypothetical protein